MPTRSTPDTDLEHVITNILQQGQDGPIRSAFQLAGCYTVYDVFTMEEEAIDQMEYEYTDTDGTTTARSILLIGQRQRIKNFVNFVKYRASTGQDIDDWTQVTDDLQKFLFTYRHQMGSIASTTTGHVRFS